MLQDKNQVPNIALFRLLQELRAETQHQVYHLDQLKFHLNDEEFMSFKESIEAIRKNTIKLARRLKCSTGTICIFHSQFDNLVNQKFSIFSEGFQNLQNGNIYIFRNLQRFEYESKLLLRLIIKYQENQAFLGETATNFHDEQTVSESTRQSSQFQERSKGQIILDECLDSFPKFIQDQLYHEISTQNLSRQEVVSRFLQKSEFKILQAIGGSLNLPNGSNTFNLFLKYIDDDISCQVTLLRQVDSIAKDLISVGTDFLIGKYSQSSIFFGTLYYLINQKQQSVSNQSQIQIIKNTLQSILIKRQGESIYDVIMKLIQEEKFISFMDRILVQDKLKQQLSRDTTSHSIQSDLSFPMTNLDKQVFIENADKQGDARKCKIFKIKRASRASYKNQSDSDQTPKKTLIVGQRKAWSSGQRKKCTSMIVEDNKYFQDL